jgi:hypothetical protein
MSFDNHETVQVYSTLFGITLEHAQADWLTMLRSAAE